ncbi:MAG: hypothetical protein EZS28_042272 [Streblomastix strix]|uniref:Uncharacterized protein n=1 Tax=Streblomastix strix TaxID=222440 RepID=A0A5J4TWH4_9EUKA|nr:MAG: hypothetical protein EZS28_042272 [Streblomastix strix]
MTSNAKEIKAIYYGLLRFEQVIKKMQDQAILIRSDNTTVVYDIEKWKAKESLIERIKQVFYLLKRLLLQIATIHIPGKQNSTIDSLSRLGTQRPGDTLPQRVQLQMEQSKIFHPSTNTSIKQSITENEVGQSTGNSNSTDLAGTIVVHQTKEFIHQVPFPWIIRENSGDGTENKRQGSKDSSRQYGRLSSGPVTVVGIDLLVRCMNMR